MAKSKNKAKKNFVYIITGATLSGVPASLSFNGERFQYSVNDLISFKSRGAAKRAVDKQIKRFPDSGFDFSRARISSVRID